MVLAFAALFHVDSSSSHAVLPAYTRTLSEIVWGTLLVAACYLIWCGIGVIRLRAWARISLLIFAAMMLFFGVIGIFVFLFVAFASDMPGPPGMKTIILATLVFVYGVPVILAFWWLILFTRRSVVAQFQARAAMLAPSRTVRFSKPGCPLPVSIVAWFLLSSILSLAILPFLPFPLPAIFFGHMFVGPVAMVLLLVQSLGIVAGSIGLLRLQRWSFPLTVGLQLFYLANGLITFIAPNYVDQARTIVKQMQIPSPPAGTPDFLRYARYFGWTGLLVPLACIIALLYSREAFYSAASPSPQRASAAAED